MAGTEYVQVCTAENIQADMTCSVPVWIEKPEPILPSLSFEEGTAISFAIVGVWIVGLTLRIIWRAARV